MVSEEYSRNGMGDDEMPAVHGSNLVTFPVELTVCGSNLNSLSTLLGL